MAEEREEFDLSVQLKDGELTVHWKEPEIVARVRNCMKRLWREIIGDED